MMDVNVGAGVCLGTEFVTTVFTRVGEVPVPVVAFFTPIILPGSWAAAIRTDSVVSKHTAVAICINAPEIVLRKTLFMTHAGLSEFSG
jgi:hypothetical protein